MLLYTNQRYCEATRKFGAEDRSAEGYERFVIVRVTPHAFAIHYSCIVTSLGIHVCGHRCAVRMLE